MTKHTSAHVLNRYGRCPSKDPPDSKTALPPQGMHPAPLLALTPTDGEISTTTAAQ